MLYVWVGLGVVFGLVIGGVIVFAWACTLMPRWR